jgi:hypothetical protein
MEVAKWHEDRVVVREVGDFFTWIYLDNTVLS